MIPNRTIGGLFIRSPEQIALDQKAAEMRSASMTYAQIGRELGVPRQTAFDMVAGHSSRTALACWRRPRPPCGSHILAEMEAAYRGARRYQAQFGADTALGLR